MAFIIELDLVFPMSLMYQDIMEIFRYCLLGFLVEREKHKIRSLLLYI